MSGMSWTLVAYAVAGCLFGGYAISIWAGYHLSATHRQGADSP